MKRKAVRTQTRSVSQLVITTRTASEVFCQSQIKKNSMPAHFEEKGNGEGEGKGKVVQGNNYVWLVLLVFWRWEIGG